MATFNVKLKSGEIIPVNHPDDWSQQQIEEAIHKNFGNDLPDSMQQKPQEKEESFGQKAFRLGIRDPAIGVALLGRALLNAPHNVASLFGLGDRVAPLAPQDFDYAKALGQEGEGTWVDKAIQMAPELGAAFAIPSSSLGIAGEALGMVPKVGKAAQSILGQTLPQVGFSAAMADRNPEEAAKTTGAIMTPFATASHLAQSASPAVRNTAKGLAALFGGYLGHKAGEQTGLGEIAATPAALFSGALAGRYLHGKGGAIDEALQGITPKMLEDVQPKIEAMKRLGHQYQTPAELFSDPYLAARQGAASRTQGGGKLMQERGEQRLANEEDILDRFMNNISSKADEKLIDPLYKEAGKTKLSSKLIDKFMENPVVQRAVSTVERAPEFQQELAGVSKNSVEYWNQVKRALDNVESKYTTSGDKVKARAVTKTRTALTEALDQASPIYEKARNAAELKITRENVAKLFNKKQMSGTTMYDFMKDKSKFDKLYNNLRNAPEAQQNLEDMRLLFKDLINPSSVRTAAQLEKTGMTKARSGGQFAEELMNKFLRTRKGEEAVADMLTNNKWMDEVRRINTISDKKRKAAEITNLLGRAMSQGLAINKQGQ